MQIKFILWLFSNLLKAFKLVFCIFNVQSNIFKRFCFFLHTLPRPVYKKQQGPFQAHACPPQEQNFILIANINLCRTKTVPKWRWEKHCCASIFITVHHPASSNSQRVLYIAPRAVHWAKQGGNSSTDQHFLLCIIHLVEAILLMQMYFFISPHVFITRSHYDCMLNMLLVRWKHVKLYMIKLHYVFVCIYMPAALQSCSCAQVSYKVKLDNGSTDVLMFSWFAVYHLHVAR